MKARRDAEDEAKRATESSDEEVVIIMRMRTRRLFVCMQRKYLTFAKKYEAKRATESSDEEVVMMTMRKMLVVIERAIESCFIRFLFPGERNK